MATRGVITYTAAPDVLAKDFRGILKQEIQKTVSEWHGDMLPNHFTRKGSRDYRYKRRSARHLARKRKRYGHNKPLVFTGDLMRQATRSIRIGGSAKKGRGTLNVPSYTFKFDKSSRQPDKADELTRVSFAEANKLAKSLESRMADRLNAVQTVTKEIA